jgi:hypothetical protein
MHHTLQQFFGLLTALMLAGLSHYPVEATSGLPPAAEFGFGGRLNLQGSNIDGAIETAAKFGFDWIAIEFDWARMWSQTPDDRHWQRLDQGMAEAMQNRMSVLLSITKAPSWALSSKGPDHDKTNKLIHRLILRYPKTLRAIELFPSANTRSGWGTQPNPKDYAKLLQATYNSIAELKSNVHLVAGGLTPLHSIHDPQDIDDIDFLEGLYSAGAIDNMTILSLRLPRVEGKPFDLPGRSSYPVLRHYEEIRAVMLQYGHRDGLVWITEFTWPLSMSETSATIHQGDQAQFITEAYSLFRAQLYIGAAFFEPLNPSIQDNLTLVYESGLLTDDSTPTLALEMMIQGIKQRHKSPMLFSDQFRKVIRKSYSKMVAP